MNNLLAIYNKDDQIIAAADKWEFSDTVMGEQFLTMDIKSPTPIQWTVGCYCMYRGQQYILNYDPSVSQKMRPGESGEAFVYDNIKMDSVAEELTRLTLLDITETGGEYSPAAGTNYTGSSKFSLYCGETRINGKTYTPVCVLAEKIYANLKRLNKGWTIHVDTTSTHKVNNEDILNTHTDEKILSFSNNTIREALEKVNTEFDLDFSIQGRNIYIGYSLGRLTEDKSITYEDGSHPFFHYGYGKGQPSVDSLGREVDGGTALYKIEKATDSSQKVITRLRAMGSARNMPYRYYNKKYNLSQSMYPSNLQLPDTFESPSVKASHNQARKDSGIYPDLRNVKGETNDAYIDKNDDAENTAEGIREHCAVWDGSDGELTEIYPTIREVKYSELRLAGTKDMKGNTPTGNMQNAFVNYSDDDRVDEIAGISDLTNYGDGLLAEDTTTTQGQINVEISSDNQKNRTVLGSEWATGESLPKVKILTIDNNTKGNFELTPAAGNVFFEFKVSAGRHSTTETIVGNIGFRLYVEDNNGTSLLKEPDGSTLPYYKSKTQQGSSRNSGWNSIEVPALPDAKEAPDTKVGAIVTPATGVVNVYIAPYYTSFNKNGESETGVPEELNFTWRVGLSDAQRSDVSSKAVSTFVWSLTETASTYMNTPFDLYLKDFGVQEMQKCFNADLDAVISMTSGRCVGREFKIESEVPEKTTITYKGKTVNVWRVRCARAQDDALQRYYPSQTDPIAIDDTFVLLNVSMPDSYINAAEIRLLTAASLYLKDNCDTRYTYQPSIDDIYLRRDYDKCLANGNVSKSIYWRLYAGLKFPFYGMPATADADQKDNIAEITIKTVTIKEGDGDTPMVEITLNDTVETSTIKKLTTAVDRICNGSAFSTGIGGASDIAPVRNQINEYGKELFLSKIDKDTAKEIITFIKGLKVGSKQFGIDGCGNAILNMINAMSGNFSDKLIAKDLVVTGMAKFFELVVEKVSSAGGAIMLTPAEGFAIEHISKSNNLVTLYWKSTNGNGSAIKNMWKEGDQAFCQSFNNAAVGNSYNMSNKKWWYKVVDVAENEEKTFDGDSSRYNSITIDLNDGMEGSSTDIAIGDNVVMLGYQGTDDADRQSALYLSSYNSIDVGLKAPFMAQYKGINNFDLASHRKSYYDATGAHIIGSLSVENEDGTGTSIDDYIDSKVLTIVNETVEYAYSLGGDEAHKPTTWSLYVPAVQEGNYLWTRTTVTYSDGTQTVAHSVSRIGVDGKGIESSTVQYYQSETAIDPEDGSIEWGDFPDTLVDGYWLYTRTHIRYSDDSETYSYSVSQIGTGSYYAGVSEYYKAGTSGTTPPDGYPEAKTYVSGETVVTTWTESRPTEIELHTAPYIWNFEISRDSRGNQYVTAPVCIGNFSRGISSIVETYAISAQSTPGAGRSYPSDITSWSDESHYAVPTAEKPYQWNKTVVTYSDGSADTHYHISAVRGSNGEDGHDAINIIINPSPIVFTTGSDGKVASGKTVSVKFYRGSTQVTPSSFFADASNSHVNCTVANLMGTATKQFTLTVSGYQSVTSVDGTTYYIAPTSGQANFKAVIDGVTYYVQIPFTVDVKAVFNKFQVDLLQFKSTYDAFEYDSDGNLVNFGSTLEQSAKNISLRVGEQAVGRNNCLPDSALESPDLRMNTFARGRVTMTDMCDGINSMIVTLDTGVQRWRGFRYWDDTRIKLQAGTYTISAMFKHDDDITGNTRNNRCGIEVFEYDADDSNKRKGSAISSSYKSVSQMPRGAWTLLTCQLVLTEEKELEFYCWWSNNNTETVFTAYIARPMVDKSDEYRGWSKSPQDYDYIGGNLLAGTQTLSENVKGANKSKVVPNQYGDCSGIVNPMSSFFDTGTNVTLSPNTDYVFSFMAKATVAAKVGIMVSTGVAETYFAESCHGDRTEADSGSGLVLDILGEWKRYWFHFRTPSSLSNAEIYLARIDGSFIFAQPKMERGTKVTDWTSKQTDMVSKDALKASGIDIDTQKIVAYTDQFVVAKDATGAAPFMTVAEDGIVADKITINEQGVFKGTLAAATGDFSGTVKASAGNFGCFTIGNIGSGMSGLIGESDETTQAKQVFLSPTLIKFTSNKSKSGSDNGVSEVFIGSNTISAATGLSGLPLRINVGLDNQGGANIGQYIDVHNAAENDALYVARGCYAGFRYSVLNVSSNTTLDLLHNFIVLTNSGDINVYLPADAETGQVYYIRSVTSKKCTVLPSNDGVSDLHIYKQGEINALGSYEIGDFDLYTFVRVGGYWLLNW